MKHQRPRLLRSLGAALRLFAASPLAAQTPRSPAINALRAVIDSGGEQAAERFWQGRRGAGPLIESLANVSDTLLVTFLYRGSGGEREVILRSNALTVLMPEGTDGHFSRITSTGILWYLTMPAPPDLRTTYSVRVVGSDGKSQSLADPLNPDSVWTSGGSRVSALTLPRAAEEHWSAAAGDLKASWDTDTLQTGSDREDQEIWVHLPPGYDAQRSVPYPLVIALNRYNFRYAISTAEIVDALIERATIPPVVLAVADELEPDENSYASSAAWIADGVLPGLRDRYRISAQASDVVLVGASRRGLVAAEVALDRSDAIGNVVSLSGAFYWRPVPRGRFEWLTARYADRPAVPVRFYLAVGTLETVVTKTNAGHYPLATSRHFADVLQARGYDYRLEEFTGTHDELNWRGWFARSLIHLLGAAGPPM